MGRITRHDFCALQEVAEHLDAVAESIDFVSLMLPADDRGTGDAHDMAAALERSGRRAGP